VAYTGGSQPAQPEHTSGTICIAPPRTRPRRPHLRSSLVYAASKEIPNRFALCQTISKTTRRLHMPNSPTESTINQVLVNISEPKADK